MAPIKHHDTLVLHKHRSPHPFFTPTYLSFIDPHTSERKGSWSSRRARKGRYSPKSHTIHYAGPGSPSKDEEQGGGEIRKIESLTTGRIKREESKFKPHLKADVSFWLAVSFTLGSMVWVVNGYLVWFPIIRPSLDTEPFSKTAAATAFLGGSIFEIGAYLGVVEVLDRGREINFGTALGELLNYRRSVPRETGFKLDRIKSRSHSASTPPATSDSGDDGNGDESWLSDKKGFIWWGKPMWHDMGYLAAIVQLFAATIFWVSTLTGLPGVIPGFADGGGSQAIIDIFFWTPQVIGGTGFIVSSLILMVEVQKKWWLPNLLEIGWWVGLWNLIGAIGFMLCGALGYASSSSKAEYQSGLATFWGSWAFLFGSFCQVWEVIWREPSDKDT
ncbi:hypothetical protein L486_02873 [Kwoniella mangroviensis CBS 10435]|uniref:Integral membrane protein n=1 Tax=Kwoniella mangroviensis CBS 10435 TaxID=1331196 RepID=A0A1B9IXD7_9TREE|nr:hypothetical protein L486_02873 [Kwoniella mangroviensis CBS 10435]